MEAAFRTFVHFVSNIIHFVRKLHFSKWFLLILHNFLNIVLRRIAWITIIITKIIIKIFTRNVSLFHFLSWRFNSIIYKNPITFIGEIWIFSLHSYSLLSHQPSSSYFIRTPGNVFQRTWIFNFIFMLLLTIDVNKTFFFYSLNTFFKRIFLYSNYSRQIK